MARSKYKKIDAFAINKSTGNPAACLYLKRDEYLSASKMLSIAKEHKGFVSEVVFCTPIASNILRLKYYSSECEVEFCGHGTIACMYDLLKNNKDLHPFPFVNIITNKGELKVYNEIERLDAVFITAPSPVYLSTDASTETLANELGIHKEDIDNGHEIALIDAGLRTLLVPIKKLECELKINPKENELKEFCLSNGIDIILVFTFQTSKEGNIARTRVFAPKFGYLEDPATGSGNSAFGYYMIKHNLWHGEAVSIEQNAEPYDYNIVKLKTESGKVLVGGNAIVKIEGEYLY